MPNGNIRAYQSDTYDKRGVSELQITNPKNEAPTLTTENAIKTYLKIETDMKERCFHRHCRVIYRACRKLYGIEKVQDECLRVFKVIYPLYYKAQKDGVFGFDDKTKERLCRIFESWKPVEGSELDLLLGTIRNSMDEEFTKESFIEFCDDILVVVMRIRKLSPVEALRLMDVSEKDIQTMVNCGISKSAIYRCAGNSIVVSVLFHIFRKLFIEPEPDMVKGEALQLSLF